MSDAGMSGSRISAHFRVQATCGAARAGYIGKIATPNVLMQTQFGQPAHLMREMLSTLPLESTRAVGVRLSHFWSHEEMAARSGKPLAEYCNLGDRDTILLLRDPARFPTPQANNTHAQIETWFGRRRLSPAEYMAMATALRPTLAVSFNDEISADAGNNRTRASIERAVTWFEECLAWWSAHSPSSATADKADKADKTAPPFMLAFLPCVLEDHLRRPAVDRIVAATKASAPAEAPAAAAPAAPAAPAAAPVAAPVAGFVLGGLGLGESPEDRAACVADTVSRLPPEYVRVLPGVGTPLEVLEAVAAGVDVLDADYPGHLTQFGYAAAFKYDWDGSDAVEAPATVSGSGSSSSASADAAAAAAASASAAESSSAASSSRHAARRGFSSSGRDRESAAAAAALSGDATKLNLRDKRYQDDESPLLPGCACFTCAGMASVPGPLPATKDGRPITHPGHMRAYIHHLLNAHEMLAEVLLHVHNTAHYAQFVAAIRRAVVAGRLREYTAWFRAVNGLS